MTITKSPMVKVRLRYPSIVITRPDKATAEALARETKTLFIVRQEDVTITDNPGNIRFGKQIMRFSKKTGREIGRDCFSSGWRCYTVSKSK